MRTDFSVGGIATDASGRVAIIQTVDGRGATRWGLPKGHPKQGEDFVTAAMRETQEETGLLVELLDAEPAGSIEYRFNRSDGEAVHKRVDFYRMEVVGGDISAHDDEVSEVALLPPSEASSRLSYANERSLLLDVLG